MRFYPLLVVIVAMIVCNSPCNENYYSFVRSSKYCALCNKRMLALIRLAFFYFYRRLNVYKTMSLLTKNIKISH